MSLTAREVETAKPRDVPYRLTDTKGLYLQVMPNGSKYWRYNYKFAGRQKTKAYGAFPSVTLARARELHAQAQDNLDKGVDPNDAVVKDQRGARYAFKSVAMTWLDANEPTWTDQHYTQILRALEAHVFPEIGEDDMREIERPKLVEVVQRIQSKGVDETAYRSAQRIGAIFDFSVDSGLLKAHPASHLVRVLKKKPAPVSHAAITVDELPELLRRIDNYDGDEITRVGLWLLARTFVRTGELIAAQNKKELMLDKQTWLIPQGRMKRPKPHVVPLSNQSCELFEEALRLSSGSPYVFAAPRDPRHHISNNTLLYALYRLGYHGRMTGHGFRSIASTVLNEQGFHRDAIERQLAHDETDEVRAAYNRAEFLPERVKMMTWWSDFLDSERARHTV